MYESTILALGFMALLMLMQLVVADVIGIKSKHPPGSPVPADHKNPLFRSTRVVGNTNESIAIFVLAALFCIFSNASPTYTAYASWGFVFARVAYAVCYYGNLKLFRSIVFGVSVLCLLVLIATGFAT